MKWGYTIKPIPHSDRPRREREHEAVMQLVQTLAGKDARLDHRPDGSPLIIGSPFHISLSHSRNYVALAWSDSPGIGIDIEELRPEQLARIAPRFLSAEELPLYGTSPDLLLQAWTLKEAAFKALRTGPADLRLYRLPESLESLESLMLLLSLESENSEQSEISEESENSENSEKFENSKKLGSSMPLIQTPDGPLAILLSAPVAGLPLFLSAVSPFPR